MDGVSVSKGIFAYGKYKFGHRKRNIKWNSHKIKPWYIVFKETCSAVEKIIIEVDTKTFKKVFCDLKTFIDNVANLKLLTDEIPTAILLAGVNLPDHKVLLNLLKLELEAFYTATIWSRNDATLRNLLEELVYQIINSSKQKICLSSLSEIKKFQFDFFQLCSWYMENNKFGTPIIIIIPDFENFSSKILHDFILILSSYSRYMKFVLIFGIATSLHAVHRLLSYNVASKLNMQVFHNLNQIQHLGDILDSLILSPITPFKITGRAFKLLIDIFLWYDFSVNGFRQNYKICIWKHFYGKNEKFLCCNQEEIGFRIATLSEDDLKQFRKIKSINKYLVSEYKTKVNSNELKNAIIQLSTDFHLYINQFSMILKCLYLFAVKLPNFPLGRNFREIYAKAVQSVNLYETLEYKESIQLIRFLSKEELLENISSMLSLLNNIPLNHVIDRIKYYEFKIKFASIDVSRTDSAFESYSIIKNRSELKEVLKIKSMQSHFSPYNKVQTEFINYLDEEVFMKYLKSPYHVPINEIFCFDDIVIINDYIRGPSKAAIHISLSDPNYFFECKCCKCLENEILQTHLDLNIIYKLHLESKKIMNIYDWMQSFAAVVDPDSNVEGKDIDPLLHARFIQAMAELQFLGIIKTTTRKTDHVKKLI